MIDLGGFVFGLVVGYLTYRTLARTTDKAAVTDLAAVVGVIGGGAVTSLYDPTGTPFAWYAVGLAAGMLLFFILFWLLNGRKKLAKVMNTPNADDTGHGAGSALSARDHGPRA
jgi:bacteriorhodopsin